MNTASPIAAVSTFPLPITQAAHVVGGVTPPRASLEPTSIDTVGVAARRAGAFRLNDIDPTTNNWLWPGRIPLGYVTLLVADPGAGKSLVALDIAARVSRGATWPDQCNPLAPREENRLAERDGYKPASVLILNIEDHFASTIRPRLDALGADCSRIFGMSHVPGEAVFTIPRPLAIDRDINRLSMLLGELTDCRLIILDPITAFFGDTSNKSTGNVWKVLSNLAWLAASANLAILAVSHLRKKEGPPIYRAMGSLAFMASARAAWTITNDPADSSRRLLLPIKSNLAESAGGLAFQIEPSPDGRVPTVRWLEGAIKSRRGRAARVNPPCGPPG
jgi:putative DNA primase/helicase